MTKTLANVQKRMIKKYKKYQNFLSENLLFLVVKFSVYLNRRVFWMSAICFWSGLCTLGRYFALQRDNCRNVVFFFLFFFFHIPWKTDSNIPRLYSQCCNSVIYSATNHWAIARDDIWRRSHVIWHFADVSLRFRDVSRCNVVFLASTKLLCWGFTAQSTQWGHVERGQFT